MNLYHEFIYSVVGVINAANYLALDSRDMAREAPRPCHFPRPRGAISESGSVTQCKRRGNDFSIPGFRLKRSALRNQSSTTICFMSISYLHSRPPLSPPETLLPAYHLCALVGQAGENVGGVCGDPCIIPPSICRIVKTIGWRPT